MTPLDQPESITSLVVPEGHEAATQNMVTGSDIIKGAGVPVLLASDSLGRLGLLRHPAPMPNLITELQGDSEGLAGHKESSGEKESNDVTQDEEKATSQDEVNDSTFLV